LLQNLTLGHYYQCSSIIHRLHPRTKILTLIPLLIVLTTIRANAVLCISMVLLAAVMYLSNVPVRVVMKQMKFFVWLVVFTFIIHSFVTKGSVLYTLPGIGIAVTKEGIINGIYFGWRLLIMVGFSVMVLLTTMPSDLADGIEQLLRPLRRIGLKIDAIALVLGIAMRFVPVLFDEAVRIRTAQIARGARFDGTFRMRLKSIAALVIPLFISVFRRADALAYALQARGYPPAGVRTYYLYERYTRADAAAYAVVFSFAAVSVLW